MGEKGPINIETGYLKLYARQIKALAEEIGRLQTQIEGLTVELTKTVAHNQRAKIIKELQAQREKQQEFYKQKEELERKERQLLFGKNLKK